MKSHAAVPEMNSKPPDSTVHTLSLVTRDHPGVLVRIALVFARRGHNIESLAVSPGATSGYARMTITSRGHGPTLKQIILQLAKLVDVVDITDHLELPSCEAEVALVKVKDNHAAQSTASALEKLANVEIVDRSEGILVFRLVGHSGDVERFIEELRPLGIQELVRSGAIVIDKGASRFAHLMGASLK